MCATGYGFNTILVVNSAAACILCNLRTQSNYYAISADRFTKTSGDMNFVKQVLFYLLFLYLSSILPAAGSP